MKEYQQVGLLYKSHKQYGRRIILLSLGLMVLGGILLGTDVRHFNPRLIFLGSMAVVLVYVFIARQTSANYDDLCRFLRKNKKELLQQKELVFFIDNQLSKSFKGDKKALKQALKDKENQEKMIRKIEDIHFLFDSLSEEPVLQKELKKKKHRKGGSVK